MLVHMEKFWEQKKVVNFFASLHIMDAHPDELPLPCFPFLLCLAFIWITLERIYGKLKKKVLLIAQGTRGQQIYFGKTSLV